MTWAAILILEMQFKEATESEAPVKYQCKSTAFTVKLAI
jgi:hypothetical protein